MRQSRAEHGITLAPASSVELSAAELAAYDAPTAIEMDYSLQAWCDEMQRAGYSDEQIMRALRSARSKLRRAK